MDIDILSVGPLQTNCYLVTCRETSAAVVIDPGGDAKVILDAIRSRGAKVKWVLNTHAHWDHIAANADVVSGTGAPLAIHKDDLPLLQAKGGAGLWGIVASPSPEPDHFLAPGEVLVIGDLCLEVLFTPGHTPGHVSFYEAQHKVVFDGDVLFCQGIGRTDLPGGSSSALMHSIHGVLLTLPDSVAVYPGHGPATTIGNERQSNPWL